MSFSGLMFRFIFRAADIKRFFLLTGIFIFSGLALSATPPESHFTNDEHVTTDLPYLTLKWEHSGEKKADSNILFEVEMARSADFSDAEIYYRGPDRLSFVSGLSEGDYFFRIRSFYSGETPGEWTDSVQVTVQYESLGLALFLFGVGGVVSVATIALVVIGDRQTRREEAKNL